jgi:hypothetical protein
MERRFIRVECDWGAEGLWDERGVMYYVASFPLSEELQRRILAWQEKFTEEAEPWSPNDKFDWDGHYAERLAIARLVKEALPDYEIVTGDRIVNQDDH